MVSRPILRLVGLSAGLLAAVLAFFVQQVVTGYRDHIAQAERDTARLARALEEHTELTLTSVDGLLRSLVDRLTSGERLSGSEAVLHELLYNESLRLPQVRTIMLIDPTGRVVADSVHAKAPPTDVSDREYFVRQRSDPAAGFAIAAPQQSRITGETFVGSSRRLETSGGSFAGVVAALIEPKALEGFYRALNIGPRGVVSLVREDGILLVREPERAESQRASLASSPLFAARLAQLPAGTYRSTYRDGVERITSYRRLAGFSVIVAVAVAVEDALSDWHEQLLRDLFILLLIASIVIGATAALVLRTARQERAEARARELESQFKRAVENVPGMIYRRRLTPDGNISFPLISAGVFELYGVSADEAKANPRLLLDAIHPQDRERVWRTQQESAQSLCTWLLEFRITRRDGTLRWLRLRSQPHRADNGDTIWDGTVVDVTEQKSYEEALHESESRYRLIADNSFDMITRTGLDNRLIYVSPAVTRLLGYAPEELVGMDAMDIVHPEDRAICQRQQRLIESAEEPDLVHHRLVRKDGGTVQVESSRTLVRDRETHRPREFVNVVRDITQRLTAEDRLKKAEARLRDAISSLCDGFILWDAEDRLVMYNEAAIRSDPGKAQALVPGEPFAEILRRRVYSGIVPAAIGREDAYIAERIAQHRNPAAVPIEQRFSDGRWMRLVEHRTGEGGVVSLRYDITEEKRRLEELRHAKEAAEQANRTKAEFLANMSHELRTPLNSIIGFSDLMKHELFGPLGHERYADCVKDIHDSGQHLLALINDVLDYAKVESGHMVLDEEDVEVAEAIQSCRRMVAERAQRAQVTLTSAVDACIGRLRADQRKLKQILLNLITNAIKYNRAGGSVSVTARLHDGALVLTVSDTGMGIPAESLATVMEPFRQVDNSYNRKHEGTGLGLPLTKRLVELHGGEILLESTLGEGTTVMVRMPSTRLSLREVA